MRWSAEAIAGFAEHAGWRNDTLVEAIALALAGSGGRDDTEFVGPAGYLSHTIGLWQIDIARFPPRGNVNLFDPMVNASAAFGLWQSHDRSWAWHPSFGSLVFTMHMERARQAVESGRRGQPPQVVPQSVLDLSDSASQQQEISDTIHRLGQAVRAIDSLYR